MIKGFGERHDRRDHGVPVRHRKRTAGQEVVLHVDDDKDVLGSWFDDHFSDSPATIRQPTIRIRSGSLPSFRGRTEGPSPE